MSDSRSTGPERGLPPAVVGSAPGAAARRSAVGGAAPGLAPGAAPRRPAVAVVMPFAGTAGEAREALAALRTLRTRPGDRLVLADNSGSVPVAPGGAVEVVPAPGEHSPSRARNAGAAAASGDGEIEWLAFLDADCRPAADLLDAFFSEPIPPRVGALAGAIRAAPAGDSVAGRYGATRNFLDSSAHLAHPFRPRLAAANLLVRRAAFDAVGGFQEGIRAAEDTDLCWRLQDAGWALAVRPAASVEHAYRPALGALRAQWRGYAAGRAWLGRRYPGFVPEPALLRAARRLVAGSRRPGAGDAAGGVPTASGGDPLRPIWTAALDAILGLEELLGLGLANRPHPGGRRPAATTVIVAERVPDPAGEPAAVAATRIEAAARPPGPAAPPGDPRAAIAYREDDGTLERWLAAARLALTRPRRVLADARVRGRVGGPGLVEIAPAAIRALRDRDPRIRSTGEPDAERIAVRLRALTAARPR